MSIKFILIVLILLTNLASSFAQSNTWQKIYRNPLSNDAWGESICYGGNNTFYVVGSVAPMSRYLYALKINGFGDTLWSRVFSYGGVATSCVQSGDGGVVFTGDYGFSMKLDQNGNIVWRKLYNSGFSYQIINTNDDGFVIAASHASGFLYFGELLKLNSQGDTVWHKIYQSTFSTEFEVVYQKIDSGYVVFGSRNVQSQYGTYIGFIDKTGQMYKDTLFVTGIASEIKTVQKFNNGYIAAGVTYTAQNSDSARICIYKIDTAGNLLLTRVLPSIKPEMLPSMVKQDANRFVISYGNFNNSLYGVQTSTRFVEVDTNLNIIRSEKLLPDSNSLLVWSCLKVPGTNSGDIICTGYSDLYIKYASDLYLCRIDSSLVSPPPISVRQISARVPVAFSLHKNYPNPFNPETEIVFDVPSGEWSNHVNVRLVIYNVLGQQISKLVDEPLTAGTYKTKWKADGFSSGVFIYTLSCGNYIESRKMMLIK